MDHSEQAHLAAAAAREILVPLNKLYRSPLNVRKKAGTGIAELAALMAAQGQLQNLVVLPERNKRRRLTGRQGVVAGGRRLAALQLLASQGKVPEDFGVRCLEVTEAEAVAVSLAENEREALHPADQYEAFQVMLDAGKTVEQIAQAWGIEPLTVQRRLRLANVSPGLLALYREDGINLEQLMALTLAPDPATQESVWNGLPAWDRSAYAIRQRLTQAEINAAGHPLARFVGLDAYEAAGGPVRRDLFSKDGADGYLGDGALLERLAAERLQPHVEQVKAEGWTWVEGRLAFDGAERRGFGRCRQVQRAASPEEQAHIDALEATLADIEARSEAGGEDEDALWEQQQAAEAQHGAAIEALYEPHPDDRAIAGAVVYIDRSGGVAVERGLIREADRAARRAEAGAAGAASGDDDDEAGSLPAKRAGKPAVPERLMRQLTAHRTAALRTCLAADHRVALCALADRLASLVFCVHHFGGTGEPLHLRAELADLKREAPDMDDSPAHIQFEEERRRWGEVLPGNRSAVLPWLLGREQDEVVALIAFCVACTVNAVQGDEKAQPLADALADALGLDMAAWWKPTRASYLGAVSKAKVIEAVTEGASATAASGMAGMKKDALVTAAERALDGSGWLPAPLRRAAA